LKQKIQALKSIYEERIDFQFPIMRFFVLKLMWRWWYDKLLLILFQFPFWDFSLRNSYRFSLVLGFPAFCSFLSGCLFDYLFIAKEFINIIEKPGCRNAETWNDVL